MKGWEITMELAIKWQHAVVMKDSGSPSIYNAILAEHVTNDQKQKWASMFNLNIKWLMIPT